MPGLGLHLGLGVAASVAGEAAAPPTSLTLTDITNNWLYQRDEGLTTRSIPLSGTYGGGDPTGIQGRVRLVSDNTVVLDWTTLTGATIGGGTWSGNLPGVPQTVKANGAYKVDTRCANATGVTAAGSNSWYVGVVIIGDGQSNLLKMFTDAISPPDADACTLVFDNGTSLWGAVPAANGVREFCNYYSTLTGTAVGVVYGGESGVNSDALLPGGGYYETLAARITASGGRAEKILVRQGEGDANTDSPVASTFLANWDTIHGALATLTGRTRSTLPLFHSSLATVTDPGFSQPDSSWATIQLALIDCNSFYANMYFSHSNMDAVTTGDGVHESATSLGQSGLRSARAMAAYDGIVATVPKWFAPSAARVSTTTLDVSLVHSMGTDFTPTTGITGFEVSGDGGATWGSATAVRQSATSIRLTHTSVGALLYVMVRYQYGKVPDISGLVEDNGSLAAPLVLTAQPLVAPGSNTDPVPIYRGTYNATESNAETLTARDLPIGPASASRLVIVSVTPWDAFGNPNSVTIGGVAATVVVTVSGSFIAQAVVPAGTVATVVGNYTNGQLFSGGRLSVWTIETGTLNSATAVDSDSATWSSSTGTTLNLSTTSGGFILAAGVAGDTDPQAASISGDATYTERNDNVFQGGRHVHADAVSVATDASNAVTITFAESANGRLIAATWR